MLAELHLVRFISFAFQHKNCFKYNSTSIDCFASVTAFCIMNPFIRIFCFKMKWAIIKIVINILLFETYDLNCISSGISAKGFHQSVVHCLTLKRSPLIIFKEIYFE